MYKKLKSVKGMNVMTREELKCVLAGGVPDCEENELLWDGGARQISLFVNNSTFFKIENSIKSKGLKNQYFRKF